MPKNEAERKAIRELLKRLREKKEEEVSKAVDQVVSEVAASARITVRLPQDARLYVDGVACPLTSSTRSFNTPTLEPGREFYYTLRAEVVRDGQARTQSQRVVVSAGRQVTVEFRDFTPAQAVTSR